MTYSYDDTIRATSFRAGREGTVITTIVIHHWGDPATNPTFDGTVAFFANGGRTTSAHYVVEAGRVSNMVNDADTAYHAGDWAMNLCSIGIECNPRASDDDKRTICELISNLFKTHGILRIIGHKDVINTDCPGLYYPPYTTLGPFFDNHPVVPPAPIVITRKSNRMSAPLEFILLADAPEGPGSIYIMSVGEAPRHIDTQEWAWYTRRGYSAYGPFNMAEFDNMNKVWGGLPRVVTA